MEVSVVIPVYNEKKYIGKCLESLKNQKEAADEIIVVDNNCTDNTANIARKFGATVVKEKKQGVIFARNKGFNSTRCSIIARIDADSIVPKNWIKKIKANFARKNIDALTGPVSFYDFPLKTPFFANLFLDSMKLVHGQKETLIGPNMAITKKVWHKVKNRVCLNDRKVHEDIDLAIHIQKIGGKIDCDKSLIVSASARRIKSNPASFFLEYPLRLLKTLKTH
jgi:glycosyltransferase involved in cell wall biosynthesis